MYLLRFLLLNLLTIHFAAAQITSGGIHGKTLFHGKNLGNVQIVLSNQNNGLKLTTISNEFGIFQLENLIPDKNYRLLFHTAYTDTLELENIEVSLGKTESIQISLRSAINVLQPVLVKSTLEKYRVQHSISLHAKQIAQIPSSGGDYTKLFGLFPQAFIKELANGGISFAGQNNRYNSLYIDGALQNDVFGLSANGMYGGQTGNVPVPIEAIEALQVQLSPYDASLGGYTGAAINMITKSGKNQPFSSIYRYMRGNQSLYNNTGLTMSGPIKENKLFYFFNADFLREAIENKYDFSNYDGNTKNPFQFQQLINSIKTNYNYDPGTINYIQQTNAFKWMMKMDYTLSQKNSIILSIRSQLSDRSNSGMSTSKNLFFSNNGKYYEHQNTSGSIEWKHQWKKNKGNSLLVSYTHSKDQTSPMGKPFPNVSILDDNGLIFIGSHEDAMQSNVQQNNINLIEKIFFTKRNQFISAGIEVELNTIENRFLQNTFGSYFYFNINDFLLNKKPGDFQINFYQPDQQKPSLIELLKAAFFVNDQILINKNIRLMGGIRISAQELLTNPMTDSFMQYKLIPALSNYYDLSGALAGQKPIIPISFSPRMNLNLQLPRLKTLINLGTGIFNGRMPLAWLGGMYNNNGLQYGNFEASPQQLNQIRFKKNIDEQWLPQQFGIAGNRGVLNIVSGKIYMPSVWRSSVEITKSFIRNWSVQLEAMYYSNIHAINFTNVNLLPPNDRLIGPDNRLVYTNKNNGKISILPDSSNPFNQVILLSNTENEKGFGYRWGFQIKKESSFGNISFNYAFGKSFAAYDGNYSVLLNQWKLNEHVNGRNNISVAISDFSPGHRININCFKEWRIDKKNKISLSLIYNGSSGNRFSYVYGKKSLVRDDENSTGFELIYIPTREELSNQFFLPIISNEFYYTAEQQKEALEIFIEQDEYLKSKRGRYAERNASNTPFIHRMDCRIATYTNLHLNKRKYGIAFSLDIFNLTNLLNETWGKSFYVPGNRHKLIDFVGYINQNQLIPIFNFNPQILTTKPWVEQISPNPHFSSNWTLQMGCRINFY
ncbi:MAG: hypothetical protein WCP74_00215 [Sphingobacteriia bacterium]|jgi:hypothetical protein